MKTNFSPKYKLLNFRSSETFLLVFTEKKQANQLLGSLNWTQLLQNGRQEWVSFQKVPWNTWALVAGSAVLLSALFFQSVRISFKSDAFL